MQLLPFKWNLSLKRGRRGKRAVARKKGLSELVDVFRLELKCHLLHLLSWTLKIIMIKLIFIYTIIGIIMIIVCASEMLVRGRDVFARQGCLYASGMPVRVRDVCARQGCLCAAGVPLRKGMSVCVKDACARQCLCTVEVSVRVRDACTRHRSLCEARCLHASEMQARIGGCVCNRH